MALKCGVLMVYILNQIILILWPILSLYSKVGQGHCWYIFQYSWYCLHHTTYITLHRKATICRWLEIEYKYIRLILKQNSSIISWKVGHGHRGCTISSSSPLRKSGSRSQKLHNISISHEKWLMITEAAQYPALLLLCTFHETLQ